MALKNKTPQYLHCAFGQCRGVWEEISTKYLVIIGKNVNDDLEKDISPELKQVSIPIKYFENIGGPISRWLRKYGW